MLSNNREFAKTWHNPAPMSQIRVVAKQSGEVVLVRTSAKPFPILLPPLLVWQRVFPFPKIVPAISSATPPSPSLSPSHYPQKKKKPLGKGEKILRKKRKASYKKSQLKKLISNSNLPRPPLRPRTVLRLRCPRRRHPQRRRARHARRRQEHHRPAHPC